MENYEQKLISYRKDLASSRRRFKYSHFLLIPMLTAWPLGFFIHPAACFIIFLFFLSMWAVSSYISFMHCIAAEKRLNALK